MDKKSQARLIKGLVIGILLISIFSLIFVLAEENNATNTNDNVIMNDSSNLTEINETNEPISENVVETEANLIEEQTLLNSGTASVSNNKINYDFNGENTEITLYKNGEVFTDVYLNQDVSNSGKYKFGAEDASLSAGATEEYYYVINSTQKLIKLEKTEAYYNEKTKEVEEYHYPVFYNYKNNPEDYWNEYRYIYDFKDICSKDYSDCSWEYYDNSAIIYFTSDGNIDPAIENVSSCKTLTIENQYYKLNQSLSNTSTCLVVANNSITIDLNGKSISGDRGASDSAIYNLNYENLKVIGPGSIWNFGKGIYSSGNNGNFSGFSVREVSTINPGFSQYGLALEGNNNYLENITVDLSQVAATGTYNYSILYGIYMTGDSNIISNSNIQLTASHMTSISGAQGIWTMGSSNNNITNTTITTSAGTWHYDVDLEAYSADNILLNCTYNKSTEDISAGSSLFRKWYYKVHVNDTAGNNVSNVEIKAYNSSGALIETLTTNSNGLAEGSLIDYYNYQGTRSYYSNYTIYADKACYPSYRYYYNVTAKGNSFNESLTLGSSTYQTWNWNFADNCNITNKIFNVQNISSSGSGAWNLNNVSITTTNFDMNSSGTWSIIGSPVIKIIGA